MTLHYDTIEDYWLSSLNVNTCSVWNVLIYVKNGNSWLYVADYTDINLINIVSGLWDYYDDNPETEEEWMKKDIFFIGGDYDDEGMVAFNRE